MTRTAAVVTSGRSKISSLIALPRCARSALRGRRCVNGSLASSLTADHPRACACRLYTESMTARATQGVASHLQEDLMADPTSGPPTPEINRRSLTKAFVASLTGTSLEWYDFAVYSAAAALVFPHLFFPGS